MKTKTYKQTFVYYDLIVFMIFITTLLLVPSSTLAADTDKNAGKVTKEDITGEYAEDTLVIDRSEGLKANAKDYYNLKNLLTGKGNSALSGNMDLDSLTKNLVKSKYDRKASYIKTLQNEKKQLDKSVSTLKLVSRARAVMDRNKGVVNSDKQQKVSKLLNTKTSKLSATQKALLTAKAQNRRTIGRYGTYKKVQKYGGSFGRIMSLFSAGQNSYYYDSETKKTYFSTGAYLKNAAMNLSGISLITGTYEKGQRAKEKEFERAMAEAVAAGADRNDPAVISEAWRRATRKGLLTGVYEGAKCIPMVGDALNVYEITESSIGLIHDTMESNRILAENETEQKRQGQDAVSKLKNKFAQIKSKEAEFRRIQREAEAKIKDFNGLNQQYIEVFTRLVEGEQNLNTTDSLVQAAEKAKPFMDAERIAALKADSEKMIRATATTVKLANITLENYQADGGNPKDLNKTIDELQQMVGVLTTQKDECDATQQAISPLLGGGSVLNEAEQQNQQITSDRLLFNTIRKKGAALVKETGQLTTRAAKLKAEQDEILANSKRSLSYFYRKGDTTTKTDLEIAFREVVQYKIDEFSLRKFNEGYKTVAIKFKDWRRELQPTGDIPQNIKQSVDNAIALSPEIDGICDALDTSITSTQVFLENLVGSDVQINRIESDTKKTPQSSPNDKKLFNLSIDDMRKQIQFRERGGAIREGADLYCGYQAYRYSSPIGVVLSDAADKDVCAKEVETGITTIVDLNSGKKKNVKYSIYYSKDIIGGGLGLWSDYYRKESRLNELIEKETKDYDVQAITIKNAHDAYVGKLKSRVHNMVRGFAFKTPFHVEIDGWVDCIVDETIRFSTRSQSPYDINYWGVFFEDPVKAKKLQDRMAYWSSQLNTEMADNLNSHMTLPVQMIAFTDKYFWKDVRQLFKGLEGRRSVSNNNSSYISEQQIIKKKWQWDNHKAEVKYNVRINAKFPSNQESWHDRIEASHLRLTQQCVRYSRPNAVCQEISIPGADIAFLRKEKRVHNFRRRNGTTQTKTISGTLSFMKSNVIVEVSFNCHNVPLDFQCDFTAIAKIILSNFNKPVIQ